MDKSRRVWGQTRRYVPCVYNEKKQDEQQKNGHYAGLTWFTV